MVAGLAGVKLDRERVGVSVVHHQPDEHRTVRQRRGQAPALAFQELDQWQPLDRLEDVQAPLAGLEDEAQAAARASRGHAGNRQLGPLVGRQLALLRAIDKKRHAAGRVAGGGGRGCRSRRTRPGGSTHNGGGNEGGGNEIYNYVSALAGLPGGLVASGSLDTTVVRVWEVESGRLVRTLAGQTGYVMALTGLPGGLVASGSHDNTVAVWRVADAVGQ